MPQPSERSGPLIGHLRKGRVYRSPLAATGVLEIADWIRDDLPDLLWPVLVAAELGTSEIIRFVQWQKNVQSDLSGKVEASFLADCLDGRLTSLDRLDAHIPEARTVVRARADEQGLLPESVAAALAVYPRRPGEWLVEVETQAPAKDEIGLLTAAVLGVVKDGHREAVIKCLRIWSNVQAGTFGTSPDTVEVLRTYPGEPTKRAMADTVVRSMWGAHRGMLVARDENHFADAIRWARVSWGTNSITTRCVRQRELPTADDQQSNGEETATDQPAAAAAGPDDATPGELPEDGAHLRQLAMDLLSSYVEALETSPARLHDHKFQEVHAGLVARAGRDLITALGAPDLWCMEHGAHIIRVLVEVWIYLQWMAQQDPSIYRRFQDYGAGKAKLYARIMDELPAEARRPDFDEAMNELADLSHNHDILDHRTVDTRDSFAEGKSIRAMADECGLLDLYRQAYSMASGVAHSEWWSVETHAMERCLNVLHGGHLIPSLSLSAGGNVALASSWVDQLYALIRTSLSILGTNSDAVQDAFQWLTDAENDDHDGESTPVNTPTSSEPA